MRTVLCLLVLGAVSFFWRAPKYHNFARLCVRSSPNLLPFSSPQNEAPQHNKSKFLNFMSKVGSNHQRGKRNKQGKYILVTFYLVFFFSFPGLGSDLGPPACFSQILYLWAISPILNFFFLFTIFSSWKSYIFSNLCSLNSLTSLFFFHFQTNQAKFPSWLGSYSSIKIEIVNLKLWSLEIPS